MGERIKDNESTETRYYKSKIDWWVYAILLFIAVCCMIGPIFTHSDYWIGIFFTIIFGGFILSLILNLKYCVRGKEFGIRYLYHWSWFPVDKIESIKPVNSILASAALSTKRLAIKFSDRKVLKSSMPLEISPTDKESFIKILQEINPTIKVLD